MLTAMSVLIASSLTLGAATGPASRPASPLSALPSKAGEHVARIQALGDNAWLNLGRPEADPKWGVARGRSWGGRALTFAPDLRGAFFCGEGVHGWTKPDGYYMCDLWFYDLNANRWLCLDPGVASKTVQLSLDDHGFEVDLEGNQRPTGYLGHAYGSTTYDSDRRMYMVLYTYTPYINGAIPQRQEWLGVPPETRGREHIYQVGRLNQSAKHPLFWDVTAGRWDRRFVDAPGGFDGTREDGVLQYVPSLKQALFAIRNQVWFYDYEANAWTGSAKTGNPVSGYENGCYDPKRERLYIGRGKQFAVYDVQAARWTEIKAPGQPEDFYSSNTVCLNYDSANNVVLYHQRRDKPSPGYLGRIAVYEPARNVWTEPARTFPQDQDTRYALVNSFYDPELNAHFFYLANDSSDRPGVMLVYRYKRAPAPATQATEARTR
jgi:hypothetical protein